MELNLPTLKHNDTNENDQWKKVVEGFGKLKEAFQGYWFGGTLQGCLGLIQATKGMIEIIATEEQIKDAIEAHWEKLRGQGWQFEQEDHNV